MNDPTTHDQHVEVTDNGRRVADAGISTSAGPGGTAHVDFHAESGHLPAGTRSKLVNAVMDEPDVHGSAHLRASLPGGDAETMGRLRERTTAMVAHSAGSTVLISATPRRPRAQTDEELGVDTTVEGAPSPRA